MIFGLGLYGANVSLRFGLSLLLLTPITLQLIVSFQRQVRIQIQLLFGSHLWSLVSRLWFSVVVLVSGCQFLVSWFVFFIFAKVGLRCVVQRQLRF